MTNSHHLVIQEQSQMATKIGTHQIEAIGQGAPFTLMSRVIV